MTGTRFVMTTMVIFSEEHSGKIRNEDRNAFVAVPAGNTTCAAIIGG